MQILITGGTGYIGSHTCIELIKSGYKPIIIDNLSNSSVEVIKRIEKITNQKVTFYKEDIRNKNNVLGILKKHNICGTIHFAGLKAVNESINDPLKYYDNNVGGTINLLETLQQVDCKNIIFSSSATVYGNPKTSPIKEEAPVGNTTNPYGASKLIIEEILRDIYLSDTTYKIALLRYFNPIGAHKSGDIGDDPNGIPNNIMPFISQTALGKFDKLKVFGGDYPTIDGTGVRDYIHVVDLAKGHIKALEYLLSNKENEVLTINLGTGKGTSVLELLKAFELASDKKIPYEIVARRDGDIAICYADVYLAKQKLSWQTKYDIKTMCKDTWNWQNKNPNGYK